MLVGWKLVSSIEVNMANNYKINLPQTAFPMKAELAKREPQFLEYWRQIDLYKKLCALGKDKPKFILHDGPPYANGPIHLGQALNKILKDIILKYKRLSGYAAPYVPGWDCHGLPIELNLEKSLGKTNQTPEQFIAACRTYAEQQVQRQKQAFCRLGVIGDWEHPYHTMDFKYEADTIRAFAKIAEQGYLVRGDKPVHWCVSCGSALAEAEVEYKDKTSPALDIGFKVIGVPAKFTALKLKPLPIIIPIWTTTPWTLPANEAVALNPNIEYSLVEDAKRSCYFVIASALLLQVAARYASEFKVITTCLGRELEKLKLQHPFLDKIVPTVLGDHVTIDAGTGAVHTAPVHGRDDYIIGQQYNLPMVNPVDPNGCFNEHTPIFAKENVFKANDHVIQVLTEKGTLIHAETVTHSYPHCWRHKTPLIFRATTQWFINLDKNDLRQRAMQASNQVQWIPEHGRERMHEMLEKRFEWCVSRQRLWFTPMAIFVNRDTGALHPEAVKLMELVAQGVEKEGIAYWYKLNTQEFLTQHTSYPAANYIKNMDALDVWFDSGVVHFCVPKQHAELTEVADLYLEGCDQYRGWFQSSLLTAIAINGGAPYKAVISHGFTVDDKGHKMSKSVGNVIDPIEVVNQFGADILRLWVASSYYTSELGLSKEILQREADVYRMLRNTARFLLGNLCDFKLENLLPLSDLLDFDRWALNLVWELQKEFKACYENYSFHLACNALESLISGPLSGFYFSVIKDRLYTMSVANRARRSAQTAMFYMLEILVRCWAPILSFTAEEIWQEMKKIAPKREESVFLTSWFNELAVSQQDKLNWDKIRNVRDAVYRELEKMRAAGLIGSSLDAEVDVYCSGEIYNILKQLQFNDSESELRFILITSYAKVYDLAQKPQDAVEHADVCPGLWIKAKKSTYPKCARCWHHREDIGGNSTYPDLCSRCVVNESKEGENRRFA